MYFEAYSLLTRASYWTSFTSNPLIIRVPFFLVLGCNKETPNKKGTPEEPSDVSCFEIMPTPFEKLGDFFGKAENRWSIETQGLRILGYKI